MGLKPIGNRQEPILAVENVTPIQQPTSEGTHKGTHHWATITTNPNCWKQSLDPMASGDITSTKSMEVNRMMREVFSPLLLSCVTPWVESHATFTKPDTSHVPCDIPNTVLGFYVHGFVESPGPIQGPTMDPTAPCKTNPNSTLNWIQETETSPKPWGNKLDSS